MKTGLFTASSTIVSTIFFVLPVFAVKTPAEIAEIAKPIAVQVNPPDGYASAGGSGVIIAKEGNVYTVLTNHHVACLEPANPKSCLTAGSIRTHLGKSYPVIAGSVVSLQVRSNDPDLATVKFTSFDNYPVATLGNSNSLKEATDIYIYGYPALENKIRDKRDSSFGKGYIVGLPSNPQAGYSLKYDIKTWWGQSGSPLFDPDGRLIGIHGRTDTARNPIDGKETQTGFNLGIPINTFRTILAGTDIKLALVTNSSPSTFQTINLSNPTDAESFYKRGTISYNKGEYQSAINDLDASIKLNFQNAEAYLFRGNARSRVGDKQGAIADFNEAIRINPTYIKAYYNRGIARLDIGENQGAIADFNEVIKINPDIAGAYSNRGFARSSLGDKRGAIVDYNLALKIDPTLAEAYSNRGVASAELGESQKAIADFNTALKINPNIALAYYNRGVARGDLNENQGAIEDFNEALRINPNFALAYSNRGVARRQLGDKLGAISDYDQALKLNPNNAEAYNNRGVARADSGENQGAIADFNEALKLNPDFPMAYNNRGIVRLDLGDRQGAVQDFSKAAEIFGKQGDQAAQNKALGILKRLQN